MSTTVLSQTGTGSPIDRSVRPPSGPPPSAVFPKYESFTMPNGLKVFLVRDQRPLVTMRLMIRGGKMVNGENPLVADAAADILTKGATGVSAQEFANRIDFVGGSIGASADADAINVAASGLKRHLPTILDLYAKVIQSPAYPEDELEKYKEQQVSGLQASRKDPGFLADQAVNKVLYGGTPLGVMPTEELIADIDRDEVAAFHATWFSPNNASLAVVGDFTVDELKGLLNQYFGSWKKGNVPALPKLTVPTLNSNEIVIVDRPTAVQSAIRVVGKGPEATDPMRPRTFILNAVLGGGGLSNRLATNLRETHAWTYTPFSYFDINLLRGFLVAGADVRNPVTDSAVIEMIREMDRLIKEPVPQDELRRTVQAASGGYLMSLANPDLTARRVQSIDFYGLPRDYYDKLVATYNSTTPNQLMELAAKYLKRDNLAVVIVGKSSEIQPKLESLASVVVWDENLQPASTGADVASLGITAQDAWSKLIDAMGGEKNLKAVKSLSAEGEMNLMGQAGTFRQVQAYPTKEYVELSLGGMKLMQQFNDGTSVAQIVQGRKAVLDDEEAKKQIAGSRIFAEVYAQDLGADVKLVGTKSVKGREALVVRFAIPGADEQTYYLDRESYLPLRIESGETARELGDWEETEGVWVPETMTLFIPGAPEIVISNIEYTVNGPVDDKIFRAE